MEEIWKKIEGYENYEVSNMGNVRNNKFKKAIKQRNDCGYNRVGIYKNGELKMFLVHRLVSIAFISNPDNKPQVNHIDGNKSNNNISNLEWCTRSENQIHSQKVLGNKNNFQITGGPNKGKFGRFNIKAKPVNQYGKDGVFIKNWKSIIDIKNEIGLANISACCKGKLKTCGGFIWKYV